LVATTDAGRTSHQQQGVMPDESAVRRSVSAVVMAGLLIALAVVFDVTRPSPQASVGLGGALTGVRAKEIDLVVDLSKLFINWSFAVIAANTYFLKAATEAKVELQSPEVILAEVAVGAAIVSLLCGQITISHVVMLLEMDQFSAANPMVNRYVTWQYRALVIAVSITAASTHMIFWRRRHVSPT
jgi:hypothetical protein